MSYWTNESTAMLKTLFAQGLTHLRIAAVLSATYGHVSRKSVGSKCARLQLVRPDNVTVPKQVDIGQVDLTWQYPETPTTVKFMDRQPHQCSWPVGTACGAAMLCCGDTRVPNQPYCTEHQNEAREKNPRPLRF